MNLNFNVDSDIRKAETLPAIFYKDPELFEIIKKKIFLRTWHWIGDENLILEKKSLYPLILLEGYLDEPLLLSRTSSNNIKCLSNVCTHRGNLLVLKPSNSSKIRCMYHGRRFKNDGKFEFMPDFEKTKNFPRDCDNLHAFLVKSWNKLLFVGFNPIIDIDKVVDIMDKRIGAVQTPGGSGALKVGFDLINSIRPGAKVWMSRPTWANHMPIARDAGMQIDSYPYFRESDRGLDFEAMMAHLDAEAVAVNALAVMFAVVDV